MSARRESLVPSSTQPKKFQDPPVDVGTGVGVATDGLVTVAEVGVDWAEFVGIGARRSDSVTLALKLELSPGLAKNILACASNINVIVVCIHLYQFPMSCFLCKRTYKTVGQRCM